MGVFKHLLTVLVLLLISVNLIPISAEKSKQNADAKVKEDSRNIVPPSAETITATFVDGNGDSIAKEPQARMDKPGSAGPKKVKNVVDNKDDDKNAMGERIPGDINKPGDKTIVKAQIKSCGGWSLSDLPEIHRFIFADVPYFENVEFVEDFGAPPDLMFLDKDGKVIEKIRLTRYNRTQCNEFLESRGFMKNMSRTNPFQREVNYMDDDDDFDDSMFDEPMFLRDEL